MMHPLDQAIASSLPVLPAPAHGDLPSLMVGKRRLVLGRDGLYLEARSPSLHLCVKLHAIDRLALPYGTPAQFIRLLHGRVPEGILQDLIGAAMQASPVETARAVIAHREGYAVVELPIEHASAGHVRYRDEIDDDALVIDMHSHGCHPAFFSETDNQSDLSRRGPYISIVIGRCDSHARCQVAARISCSPYLVDLDAQQLKSIFGGSP